MRNQHFEVALQALMAHWLEIPLGMREKVAPCEMGSPLLSSGVVPWLKSVRTKGHPGDQENPHSTCLQRHLPPWGRACALDEPVREAKLLTVELPGTVYPSSKGAPYRSHASG